MEPILLLLLCLLLVVAVVLLARRTTGAAYAPARIEALERRLEQIDRSLREEFRSNRQESADAVQRLSDSLVRSQTALGDTQASRLEAFAQELATFSNSTGDQIAQLRIDMNQSLHVGATTTRSAVENLAKLTLERVDAFASALNVRMQALEESCSRKIGDMEKAQDQQWAAFRAELDALRRGLESRVDDLREKVERRLEDLQHDNAAKLDQMRQTVDEKLQSTLEARLGESFRQVSERLEQVYRGLGEMQALATGVGDLKRVLSNVKARGTWGEVQLETLLEQALAREQYEKNVATSEMTGERVEFAIRLPGRSGNADENVWLPIDSKFPLEDYQNLLDASDRADSAAIEEASRRLEGRVKACAKDISAKYLNSPRTTDFAIMFLPIEGLYAEVLRRPGVADAVQHDYRVLLAGPTTLWAILSALQMGFKTLSIERRSSEVWALLAGVKTEFGRFGTVLDGIQKNLNCAATKIDEARKGTRKIERKLTQVQELPSVDAAGPLEGVVLRKSDDPESVSAA